MNGRGPKTRIIKALYYIGDICSGKEEARKVEGGLLGPS